VPAAAVAEEVAAVVAEAPLPLVLLRRAHPQVQRRRPQVLRARLPASVSAWEAPLAMAPWIG